MITFITYLIIFSLIYKTKIGSMMPKLLSHTNGVFICNEASCHSEMKLCCHHT